MKNYYRSLKLFKTLCMHQNIQKTPIIIKEKRPQHESSLEYNKSLDCAVPFGNSYISIEVKMAIQVILVLNL